MLGVNSYNRRLFVLVYTSEPVIPSSGTKHVSWRATLHIHHFLPIGPGQHTGHIHHLRPRGTPSHIRCVSLTDKATKTHTTSTRNVTCLVERTGCGPVSACVCAVNRKSGESPAPGSSSSCSLRGGPQGSHPFSWWLLAAPRSFKPPPPLLAHVLRLTLILN